MSSARKIITRLLARQLAHPRGLGGRLTAFLMNRSNAAMNAFTVEQLAAADGERIVDVGFGGGPNLRAFAAAVGPRGEVVGVDRATEMLARGATEFADLVRAGRLRLLDGTIESLPLDDASIDGLCTVNTVYFWTDRERAAKELARVVRPGGRVVITFLPRARMAEFGPPTSIFRYTEPDEVEALLRGAGFTDVRTIAAAREEEPWCCVRATSPA